MSQYDYTITIQGKNFSDNIVSFVYNNTNTPIPFANSITDANLNTIFINNTSNYLTHFNGTDTFTASGGTYTNGEIVAFSGTMVNGDIANGWNFLFRTSFIISNVSGVTFKLEQIKVITFGAYENVPSDLDESIELKYWSGGYKRISRCRLQMKIKTKFFKNFGYFNDEEGQAKFMLIKEVLRMKYKQILAIGKGFDRWVCTSEPDTQISPITASTFQNLQQLYPSLVLPLKFEVYNFGELTTIAAKNRTQTEFTLVTPELFNFN